MFKAGDPDPYRYERPIMGVLTQKKHEAFLNKYIIYEPRICLQITWPYYIALKVPFFNIEFYPRDRRGDFVIKCGDCWHHVIHDLKCHGLIGFIRHIKKYW